MVLIVSKDIRYFPTLPIQPTWPCHNQTPWKRDQIVGFRGAVEKRGAMVLDQTTNHVRIMFESNPQSLCLPLMARKTTLLFMGQIDGENQSIQRRCRRLNNKITIIGGRAAVP